MAKTTKPIQPESLLEAAGIIGGPGSSDKLRASYTLLAAATTDVQAELVRVYESAQNEMISELARLKQNNLVTVHIEAAKQRIEEILKKLKSRTTKLCGSLVRIGVVQGKVQGEIRNLDKERINKIMEESVSIMETIGFTTKKSGRGYRMIITNQAITSFFGMYESVIDGKEFYLSNLISGKEVLKSEASRALNGAYIELPSRKIVFSKTAGKLDRQTLRYLVDLNSKAIRKRLPLATHAFVLSQGDEKNVERILNQMLGNLNNAISKTEEKIKGQLSQIATHASYPAKKGENEEKAVSSNVKSQVNNSDLEAIDAGGEGLTEEQIYDLSTNPSAAQNKLLLETKKHVAFMKTQYVIGRREQDVLRQKTLAELAKSEAKGGSPSSAMRGLLTDLMRDGFVAFQDRSGRRWSLNTYCEMTTRTGSRQSINIGELYDDEEHDLYYIVPRNSNCPVCSKYEGRVYSRSGKDKRYPPLYKAFGKIDPHGPDSIENTYVSIHPNCKHALARWNEKNKSTKEIQEMQKKSNESFDIDRRTEVQVKAYKEKERINGLVNQARKRFKEIAAVLGFNRVGAYPTFEKHYLDKDDWYKKLVADFQKAVNNMQGEKE